MDGGDFWLSDQDEFSAYLMADQRLYVIPAKVGIHTSRVRWIRPSPE